MNDIEVASSPELPPRTTPAAQVEPATPSDPQVIDVVFPTDITDGLQALSLKMDAQQARLVELTRLSEERERIIDRLHAEVQVLRAGELEKALAPLVRDLIRLFDQLQRASSTHRIDGTPAADNTARALEGFRDEVSDILYRNGVEPYDAAQGTRFNPREHRSISITSASDDAQDGCIARVLRTGFRSGERVVRHLDAEVYRRAAPSEQGAQTAPTPEPRT